MSKNKRGRYAEKLSPNEVPSLNNNIQNWIIPTNKCILKKTESDVYERKKIIEQTTNKKIENILKIYHLLSYYKPFKIPKLLLNKLLNESKKEISKYIPKKINWKNTYSDYIKFNKLCINNMDQKKYKWYGIYFYLEIFKLLDIHLYNIGCKIYYNDINYVKLFKNYLFCEIFYKILQTKIDFDGSRQQDLLMNTVLTKCSMFKEWIDNRLDIDITEKFNNIKKMNQVRKYVKKTNDMKFVKGKKEKPKKNNMADELKQYCINLIESSVLKSFKNMWLTTMKDNNINNINTTNNIFDNYINDDIKLHINENNNEFIEFDDIFMTTDNIGSMSQYDLDINNDIMSENMSYGCVRGMDNDNISVGNIHWDPLD